MDDALPPLMLSGRTFSSPWPARLLALGALVIGAACSSSSPPAGTASPAMPSASIDGGPGSVTIGSGSGEGEDASAGTTPDGSTTASPDSSLSPAGPIAIAHFAQGLFRGEDPRVRLVNGWYYSVFTEGSVRKMYKSQSLVDRGVGKAVPIQSGASFPLFAPLYVSQLGGVTYDAWFAFDGNEWECDCADPYDDLAKWSIVKAIPFTGWSIDFEVFQNPQPGTYQGRWYMVWAGADSPSTAWGFESVFAAELLDLRAGQATLSTFANADANRVAKYAFDWNDVIDEAPAPALHSGSVSVVYSGNGAETDDYALGVAILKSGADPSLAASWIDHNQGQCDGDVVNGPELARTATVLGPGVARFTTSRDGTEDWMLYHAKVFDTYNTGAGTPGQQDNNEEWTREVNAEPISWRNVTCGGTSYAIPKMGAPADEGSPIAVPSGDPGLTPGLRRIEAEAMVPAGYVMGPTMQGIARTGGNSEVLIASSSSASNGEKVTHLDALAADVSATPKQSALVWRNSAGGSLLTVASASVAAANLDLYVGGTFVETLALPATGSTDTFQRTTFKETLPAGGEIKLVYEVGKSAVADLDYIEVAP